MTPKRFATIATEDYLPYTRMLYHSLMQSNPEAELTVFSDSEHFPKLFGHNERISFRVLPSIRELGVKRAKFDLYVEMSGQPFTYLDSDIIVLEDLSSIFTGDMIAACSATLEECPFIEDREYPWPGDPLMRNQRYCNAGLLFFPTAMHGFLKTIRALSRDDETWRRYIIPGRLYDNHFFCAMLNRFNVDFRHLDPAEFGIAGFRSSTTWNVTRRGDHLINKPTGKTLHLAHFAFAQDPDYCFARMPAWLAAFLQDRSDPRPINRAHRHTLDPPKVAVMQWIEGENADLVKQIQEDLHLRILSLCGREIDAILADPSRKDGSNESFFQYPEELQELLFAHNGPADQRWKNLSCNRAYLTPLEYEFVEECIRRYAIKSVVESGAGETSVLFRQNGCSVVSIEWQEGAWAERAREAGADVHIVPFDDSSNLYDCDQVKSALAGISSDLLFVDSPMGGIRRRGVPYQFLDFIDPRYVLVHDVSRDHRNVFEWMRDNGWALVEYYPSHRGILLLERKIRERTLDPISISITNVTAVVESENTAAVAHVPSSDDAFSWELAVLGALGPLWVSGRYFVPVALVNHASRDLGAGSRINLSYHWRRADTTRDMITFDGDRSEIHPDLRPGETRRMLCEISAPAEPGPYILEFDLVEEGITWFSTQGHGGPLRDVEVFSFSDARGKRVSAP